MSAVIDRPVREQIHSLAREARQSSTAQETLSVPPQLAAVLADYLEASLSAAADQAWFWSREWQAGERQAEADLAARRYEVFDSMAELIDDLGWPR